MDQFRIHSRDFMTDHAVTPIEHAARAVGCADDDDSPSPRFFLGIAWALGISACIWGSIILWASA